MLAKENQQRHREVKAGGKCCEARELIIGIPQKATITAEQICDTFKNRYGVECSCAIHQNNKEGVLNKRLFNLFVHIFLKINMVLNAHVRFIKIIKME